MVFTNDHGCSALANTIMMMKQLEGGGGNAMCLDPASPPGCRLYRFLAPWMVAYRVPVIELQA